MGYIIQLPAITQAEIDRLEKRPQHIKDRIKEHRQLWNAVDDISDVWRILQKEGQFAESDRLRTIMGNIARIVDINLVNDGMIGPSRKSFLEEAKTFK